MIDFSVTEMLLVTSFLMFAIWYINFHIKRKRLYELASQFGGPTPVPLIGNVLKCYKPLTEITNTILMGTAYYKSPVRLWFGPYLLIFLWDPENIKTILNSPHALTKQPYMYSLIELLTGRGLLTSPVEEWKRHRKLIAPIFNQKLLENFFPIFCTNSEKLVDSLHEKVNKGIFDVQDYLIGYSLDSILDTILDFNNDETHSKSAGDMKEWMQAIFIAVATKMTNGWYFFDFIFKMTSVGKSLKENKDKYAVFIENLIKQWENESMKNIEENKVEVENTGSYKPKKLIAHLMSISDGSGKFTVEELRGEINTIIAAGLETSSSTMGFALLMLGLYPEIQEKVYQEVIQVLGSKKQLEYEDVKHLNYVEMVIKETLRLFPPASGVARYTEQEIQLENHTIPAHTSVMIGLLGLHRDPNIWPNPSKFIPERFLPEEEEKRHPYSWIPFSAGPRNCIGIRFGLMSLKIAVSNFVLRYRVATEYKSEDDINLMMILVFKPTHGYKISITNR